MKEFINVINPPLYYECNQRYFDDLKKAMIVRKGNGQSFEGMQIRVVEDKPDGYWPVYRYTEK